MTGLEVIVHAVQASVRMPANVRARSYTPGVEEELTEIMPYMEALDGLT